MFTLVVVLLLSMAHAESTERAQAATPVPAPTPTFSSSLRWMNAELARARTCANRCQGEIDKCARECGGEANQLERGNQSEMAIRSEIARWPCMLLHMEVSCALCTCDTAFIFRPYIPCDHYRQCFPRIHFAMSMCYGTSDVACLQHYIGEFCKDFAMPQELYDQ